MPRTKETFNKQNEYNKERYDRVGIMLPKGEKEKLQEIAKAQGMSLTGLIVTAINEYLKK